MGVMAFTLPLANAVAEQTDPQPPSSEDSAVNIQAAPVKLDGKTLFNVRGVSAYPAEQGHS
ncbi:MAG: hypothetical protein WA869_16020 [Alloacidobacterium sp.]|jgi:hypothetical protein